MSLMLTLLPKSVWLHDLSCEYCRNANKDVASRGCEELVEKVQ
jgi:hypothetical protein